MGKSSEKSPGVAWLVGLALAFLVFHPHMLGSETLQMTTYYPAPYGGYVRLLTTDNTLLARDSGAVDIGGYNPSLRVSSGLNVNGNMYISGTLYGFCTTVNYGLDGGINGARCPPGHVLVGHFGTMSTCLQEKDKLGKLIHLVCDAGGVMTCCKSRPGNPPLP